MSQLPSHALKRASLPCCNCMPQKRNASLLRRPHRPYTFTQLVTLSDGSTYLSRTTSPLPIYKSTKDTRNHPLWQPSLDSLRNVEQDEAGRLRAFRLRFGRGWDAESEDSSEDGGSLEGKGGDEGEESLMDLIAGAAPKAAVEEEGKGKKGGKEEEGPGEFMKQVTVKNEKGQLVKVWVEDKAARLAATAGPKKG